MYEWFIIRDRQYIIDTLNLSKFFFLSKFNESCIESLINLKFSYLNKQKLFYVKTLQEKCSTIRFEN